MLNKWVSGSTFENFENKIHDSSTLISEPGYCKKCVIYIKFYTVVLKEKHCLSLKLTSDIEKIGHFI